MTKISKHLFSLRKEPCTLIASVVITLALASPIFTSKALAQMTSQSYEIQFGNINMTSGSKSSSSYKVTDTAGQTAPGKYGTTGSIVKAGFQYIYTIGRFSFSLSNTAVAFGTLTPGVFSTGATGINVYAKGAGGYTVSVYENMPLTIPGTSATVPNTTCDSGSCSYGTVGVWTNPAKYGFGYSMSGADVPTAFVDSTYFKAFPALSLSQPAQVIMSNAAAVRNQQATLTYKISVSGTQEAGNYENAITFIAVPGY